MLHLSVLVHLYLCTTVWKSRLYTPNVGISNFSALQANARILLEQDVNILGTNLSGNISINQSKSDCLKDMKKEQPPVDHLLQMGRSERGCGKNVSSQPDIYTEIWVCLIKNISVQGLIPILQDQHLNSVIWGECVFFSPGCSLNDTLLIGTSFPSAWESTPPQRVGIDVGWPQTQSCVELFQF